MVRWGRFAAAYAVLAVVAYAIAVGWRGESPLLHPAPWIFLTEAASHGYSTVLGLTFGAIVILASRFTVTRLEWAKRLHDELRPIARGLGTVGIVVLALLSSLGEELLFRGLLQPALGLVGQALVFGIVHQLPGPSRWVWVLWATVVGLALGAIFQLSGSLAGPLAAHALINGVNLAFLRSHDPAPPRGLGGLLGEGRGSVRS